MGTSKSLTTPSGGGWAPAKSDVTGYLKGRPVPVPRIVGKATAAMGALSTTGIGGGGGAGGGAARARRASGRIMGGAIGGLGGLGGLVHDHGLDAALSELGLAELQGQPAPDVVAQVAEHLCGSAKDLDHDVLLLTLQRTLLEAAELGDDIGYEDLDAGLSAFLDREGVPGLVQVFMRELASEMLWALLEEHAQSRAEGPAKTRALHDALRHACSHEVQIVIASKQQSGEFDQVDWFGPEGRALGREVVREVEARLKALRNSE